MSAYTILAHMPGACSKFPHGNPDLISDPQQKKAAMIAAAAIAGKSILDPKLPSPPQDIKTHQIKLAPQLRVLPHHNIYIDDVKGMESVKQKQPIPPGHSIDPSEYYLIDQKDYKHSPN